MALDNFSADEHFPAPIERRQEETVISETKSNIEVIHLFQDFPKIKQVLTEKRTGAHSVATGIGACSIFIDQSGNGFGSVASSNGMGRIIIRNWEIISVK